MKLKTGHAAGIKFVLFPLAILLLCLFGQALTRYCDIFEEFQATLLSLQWMLLLCLLGWCGTFLFLTFSWNDLFLIGLLVVALAMYFISYATLSRSTDAILLFSGVTLGKGARFLFKSKTSCASYSEIQDRKLNLRNFILGLVGLLAFSSWWHLDMANNYFQGRWMGVWKNPNTYGMLMSAGLVLAIGLLANTGCKRGKGNSACRLDAAGVADLRPQQPARSGSPTSWLLFIAGGMMAVGLLFSYSRGAWLGAAVGLVYLAQAYNKLKWRWVLPWILVVAGTLCYFWNATPDTAPWYVKRLDFSRPSVQHRVAAWRGAVEMMWDHPLGLGWNRAVETYERNYSPPENGAMALYTNDYLILGTQLGWPGLIFFVVYVASQLACGRRSDPREAPGEIKTTCGAGALVLLVEFWFDGGLFTLAAAAPFWVLLELGAISFPQKSTDGNVLH